MAVQSARRGTTSIVRHRPCAPSHPRESAALCAVALAVLAPILFWPRLQELWHGWWTDPDCSHGLLIPPLCAWLTWRAARRMGWPTTGDHIGLLWVAGGCLLRLTAAVVWLPPVDFAALVAVLHGVALLAGGRAWARGLWLPTLLLGFLFPLPAVPMDQLALWLQGVVTALAGGVLGLFLPTHREGCVLHLPGQDLEVGAACSGLRQLVAFAVLTVLAGCLGRRSRSFRVLLVLCTPLVAIGANLLRVLLMALAQRWIGPSATAGAWHDAWGIVSMVCGVGLLLAGRAWLDRLLGEGHDRDEAPETLRAVTDAQRVGIRPATGLTAAVIGIGLTLAAQAVLLAHLQARPAVPTAELVEPLSCVPVSLGAWLGQDLPPTTLPTFSAAYSMAADDRLYRAYRLPNRPSRDQAAAVSAPCHVWAVYFRDGRDRQHHPRICGRAAGLEETSLTPLAIDAGPPVAHYAFRGNAGPHHVYYWHYSLESTDAFDPSPLRRLHQRSTRRSPSLTVEVFTAAASPDELANVEELVRQADHAIKGCLPAGARRGCDVLPIRMVDYRVSR